MGTFMEELTMQNAFFDIEKVVTKFKNNPKTKYNRCSRSQIISPLKFKKDVFYLKSWEETNKICLYLRKLGKHIDIN